MESNMEKDCILLATDNRDKESGERVRKLIGLTELYCI